MEDVRPPHKVTDYSSSSEESGTTDEDDDEEVDQDAADESTSGAEDTRAGYVTTLTSDLGTVFTKRLSLQSGSPPPPSM